MRMMDPLTTNPPANPSMTLGASLQVSLLCILFGANAVAVKLAFEGFGVFSAASIRFGIAALVIALWAGLTGRSFRLQPGQIRHIVVYAMLFSLQLSLFYIGLERTYASRGTLLINLLPFIVLVLAHFFIPGDRITLRKVTGLLLGFAGVLCVFLGEADLTGRARSGEVCILAATTIWACNIVYLKRVISTLKPFHIVFYAMLMCIPVFGLTAFFVDSAVVKLISAEALLALAYQSLATSAFGFIAWNSLLKKYGAVNLHSFVFIMPMVGVLLAGLILDEPIHPRLLAALALIVAGLLVIHFNPPKHSLPPTGSDPI